MKKILLAILAAIMLTSCSQGGKTAAVVGDAKITTGEFQFYLSSIKSQMKDTELQTDEDWENREIEGEKAIDIARRKAIDIAVKNVEYCQVAEKIGLNLTKEEKGNVETMKERIILGYGSKSDYKKYLKENNISDDFIDMMCKSTLYHSKLVEKISEEETVSDDECRKYYSENRSELENEYRKAKHILILTANPQTMEAYSQDKQDEAKKQAETLLKRVQSGENFDKLMNEFSQDSGLAANPDGYVFTSGEMVAEFEQAVDSVSFGGITMCKSSFGYHIIKRIAPEYDDLKKYIEEKVTEQKLDSKMKEWEKQYNITITINEEILKESK